MRKFTPGEKVIVFAFGVHPGYVVGPSDKAAGWVHVSLYDKRVCGGEFHGVTAQIADASATIAINAIKAMDGMTAKQSDGEIRVAYREKGSEASAYYTNDPCDAILTAKMMVRAAETGSVVAMPRRAAA